MVSKLIGIKTPAENLWPMIWPIFKWPAAVYGVHERWNFKRYIDELRELKDDVDSIDAIIQAGIQKKLMARLEKNPKNTNWLISELESNYDLVDIEGFNFTEHPINAEAEKYIEHICQRNRLKMAVESGDSFTDVIEIYKEIPKNKLPNIFEHIDAKELLEFVQVDLLDKKNNLNCDLLTDLDSEHRINLLEHCFSIDNDETPEDAHKKAVLVSGLLELLPTLKEKNDDDSKYIMKYMIKWALSNQGGIVGQRKGKPYYRLNEMLSGSRTLKKSLPSIVEKMAEGNIKETLQELLEVVTPKLTIESTVPEPKQEEKEELLKRSKQDHSHGREK